MSVPARQVLDQEMSEAQLQSRVIAEARLGGWLVTHGRKVQDARGRWRTPIQGDAGAPDLLLARNGVVLHVELKTERGATTVSQRVWGYALGESYRLWRPSDLPEIMATLGRRA